MMIEAENLLKDYGSIRAVNDISFTVNKGDILGFLGPNGAGKSTTMKMLTGFLPPTRGTARIGGHDIRKSPLEAKKLFGYLPENGPLYQEMTVLEFLQFIAHLRAPDSKAERKQKIEQVLETCHIREVRHQPIETLSKGYRQRVGMAQAVLNDPPVLIMDEPTDGLDPNQKQEVRRLIASMAEEKAIILSTHILEELESMCNRVIIIAQGRILVDEKPEDLRRRHPHFNAVRLQAGAEERDSVKSGLEQLPQVEKVLEDGEQLLVLPSEKQAVEGAILQAAREQGWTIEHFARQPVRLDDVFRNLTQGEQGGNNA